MNKDAPAKEKNNHAGYTPKLFPAWMAQLPDRLKVNRRLARFGTIGELAEAYLRLTSK